MGQVEVAVGCTAERALPMAGSDIHDRTFAYLSAYQPLTYSASLC